MWSSRNRALDQTASKRGLWLTAAFLSLLPACRAGVLVGLHLTTARCRSLARGSSMTSELFQAENCSFVFGEAGRRQGAG